MNAHRDPESTFKYVAITAANANPMQPYCGGELVMLDGVFSVEIGPSDVLVIDGSRYHGVAPLCALSGAPFRMQPLRHSLVHFTRCADKLFADTRPLYWDPPPYELQKTRAQTIQAATAHVVILDGKW